MYKVLLATVILLTLFSSFNCSKDSKSFFDIVLNGTPEEVQKAIEAGAKVNERDSKGLTPLMYAARFNKNPDVNTVLIKAGANVNERTSKGWTPLMYAASNNQNTEVITILLKSGADGKLKNNTGKNAFNYAKNNKYIKDTAVYWELNDAQYK